jgi:hypothetical protein
MKKTRGKKSRETIPLIRVKGGINRYAFTVYSEEIFIYIYLKGFLYFELGKKALRGSRQRRWLIHIHAASRALPKISCGIPIHIQAEHVCPHFLLQTGSLIF